VSKDNGQSWTIPAEQRKNVRAVLNQKHTARVITSAERKAVREVCASALDGNTSPEELLIQFKGALTEIADQDGLRPGPERSELLERMVSICIEEYYAIRSSRDGAARVGGDGSSPANRLKSSS
jgi:hypothetical protein